MSTGGRVKKSGKVREFCQDMWVGTLIYGMHFGAHSHSTWRYCCIFSKKKMPAVPESLLKKRKANTEARAAAAKAAVLAKKVRMLWRRVEQPPSTVYMCNTGES